MNLKEKIADIKRRFNLTSNQLSDLLDISLKRLEEIEKGNITDDEIKRIEKVFNVGNNDLLGKNTKIANMSIKKEINLKKYKNYFSACSEILKSYYPKPSKVYVLTKIKKKNVIINIFNLFFRNNKKTVINEMSNFEPSFLVKNGSISLLVHITKNFFKVDELNLNEEEKVFIFKGYRYRIANELTLK